MAISSQGTTFTFAGVIYTVTSVDVSFGEVGRSSSQERRQRVSAAFLGSDPNAVEPFFEIWQPDPQGDGANGGSGETPVNVQIEFLGTTFPALGKSGSLVIAGPYAVSFTKATCRGSAIRLAVGDMVRGSASFRVA